MKTLTLILIAVLAVGLTACPPATQSARDAIATAKGFLDAEAKAHPECVNGPVNQVCALVTRGNAAKHVALDALEQYCAGPEFDAYTGPCHVPQSKTMQQELGNHLKAALRDLDQIVSDIKKVGGK